MKTPAAIHTAAKIINDMNRVSILPKPTKNPTTTPISKISTDISARVGMSVPPYS